MQAKVQTTLRFSPEFRARLEAESERRKTSMTELLVQAFELLEAEGRTAQQAGSVVTLPKRHAAIRSDLTLRDAVREALADWVQKRKKAPTP